ncbi:DNA damage-binding protein 1a [Tanacetum coccineum]
MHSIITLKSMHATCIPSMNLSLSEDDEYEGDKYGLVKGPWFTSTINAAKLLIPVPPPCDGVLDVGDKSITYCQEQFLHDFLIENSRNDVRGCFGLRDTQLELKLHEEMSFASTLSYLCGGVVYVGFRSRDSKLIKLNLKPNISGDYKLEVLEMFLNFRPVFDCCVSKLDQQEHIDNKVKEVTGNGYLTKGRKTNPKTTKPSTEWKSVKRQSQIEAKVNKSQVNLEKSTVKPDPEDEEILMGPPEPI